MLKYPFRQELCGKDGDMVLSTLQMPPSGHSGNTSAHANNLWRYVLSLTAALMCLVNSNGFAPASFFQEWISEC